MVATMHERRVLGTTRVIAKEISGIEAAGIVRARIDRLPLSYAAGFTTIETFYRDVSKPELKGNKNLMRRAQERAYLPWKTQFIDICEISDQKPKDWESAPRRNVEKSIEGAPCATWPTTELVDIECSRLLLTRLRSLYLLRVRYQPVVKWDDKWDDDRMFRFPDEFWYEANTVEITDVAKTEVLGAILEKMDKGAGEAARRILWRFEGILQDTSTHLHAHLVETAREEGDLLSCIHRIAV